MSASIFIPVIAVALVTWFVGLLLDRVVNPWLVKRRVNKWLADVKAGRVPKIKKSFDHEIKFDANTFTVINLKELSAADLSMKWSEVCKAVAFKRDLFSVDLICLFLYRSDNSGLELDEEMKGWCEFIEAMPTYLQNCKLFEDWFSKVAFPAFAANPTEIYSKRANMQANLTHTV